jgi:hypothetical protein
MSTPGHEPGTPRRAPQHGRAGDPKTETVDAPLGHDRVDANSVDATSATVKRAPLPQWWWDQTLQTRRRVAAVVVVIFLGGVGGLVFALSSPSDDPAQGEAQTVDETAREAQVFVAALPTTRVGNWDAIAQCESEGDWGAATGNGFYGGLQFTQATWLEFGGVGSPHETTREVQIMIGESVQTAQGWGAWPACSAELGLSG